MSFDLQKIIESKRTLRRNLAARPVAEKLRLLDALRKRELAIRGRAVHSEPSVLREEPAPYAPSHNDCEAEKWLRRPAAVPRTSISGETPLPL